MKIVVSGASGLVGSRLIGALREAHHDVTALVRRTPKEGEIRWYPERGVLQRELLEGQEGFVNLSGESIAEGRWNATRKQRILQSRVSATRVLCEGLAAIQPRPKVLVNASAVGYYGDCGEEPVDETRGPGSDFLADVCRQWEAATAPARDAGIRVVLLRIGVVLSRHGGALSKMLLPFRLGGGGVVGSGRQYWSWITREDLASAIAFCLTHDSLSGPVNAVSPNPVTNGVFTKTLGKVLGRPTLFPLPGFVARIVLGEMADALLLSSTRVVPRKLIDSGFPFRYGDLEDALRFAVKEP